MWFIKTFKEVCFNRGMLNDDKKYIHAIVESSCSDMSYYLRKIFATLLISDQITRWEFVFNKIWEYLSDDILYRQRKNLQFFKYVIYGIIIIIFYATLI